MHLPTPNLDHTHTPYVRRLAVGAEVAGPDTVSFRVWAPAHERVTVVMDASEEAPAFTLDAEGSGYFSGTRARTRAGMLYWLRLDDDKNLCPDPASRFQPQGHEGPSEIVDAYRYPWRDSAWRGASSTGHVLYEMHIGTFTPQGTWRAAAAELPYLAELGVTALSVLPVGEFPGRYGWGYDVVHFFAPTHLYGTPDDMRAFVDAAHALDVAVILDVIYNHCGTIGCVLSAFAPDYFSRRYRNEWGHALNFDGENAAGVREFVLANAEYWVNEFHMDGYRLDATQAIFDASPSHIVAEITARARAAAGPRTLYIVGENEPQQVRFVQPVERGGYRVDALWNDDFHHAARVALTGRREAYYTDYLGSPQEFVSGAKRGFLYQGQHYSWQKQGRGTPAGHLEPAHFVNFLENHDQVANSTRGQRLHELTTPGRWRAATALLLLAPQTPMLFQGQEFAASTPFLYFADHDAADAERARAGRREFLEQFATIAAGGHACLADPVARETFERCKLDMSERQSHATAVALHRDLIRLRRRDPTFSAQNAPGIDGAVLGAEAFVLRFFGETGDDRLLIVNFGRALALTPLPEPLLAPPLDAEWQLLWSSEDVAYGGDGTPTPYQEGVLHVPAHAALVMSTKH